MILETGTWPSWCRAWKRLDFGYLLPHHVPAVSEPTTALDDAPARVARRLLEADRLSLSRAAELAGTDVRGMLDAMGYDLVPVVVDTKETAEVAA